MLEHVGEKHTRSLGRVDSAPRKLDSVTTILGQLTGSHSHELHEAHMTITVEVKVLEKVRDVSLLHSNVVLIDDCLELAILKCTVVISVMQLELLEEADECGQVS